LNAWYYTCVYFPDFKHKNCFVTAENTDRNT
jgi:hypothetical protein